jgi:hypothetical protein
LHLGARDIIRDWRTDLAWSEPSKCVAAKVAASIQRPASCNWSSTRSTNKHSWVHPWKQGVGFIALISNQDAVKTYYEPSIYYLDHTAIPWHIFNLTLLPTDCLAWQWTALGKIDLPGNKLPDTFQQHRADECQIRSPPSQPYLQQPPRKNRHTYPLVSPSKHWNTHVTVWQ